MSFSSPFSINKNLCFFSPCGQYMSYANQNQMVIRYTGNYELFHSFTCDDIIEHFEWSPDAEYIFIALYKRATVHVYSLHALHWHCKLKDTVAGIIQAVWAPDSRNIVTTSEFHVSLTVWSLVGRSVFFIDQPNRAINPKDAFSPDGKWFILIENQGTSDKISILSATTWKLKSNIICTEIDRVRDISWSPGSDIFSIWSDNMSECRISLYSMTTSKWVIHSKPNMPLGIKTVSWSPTGQFLAVSSYSSKVILLQHITWQSIVEFSHDTILNDRHYNVLKESCLEKKSSAYSEISEISTITTFEEITERPVTISSLRLVDQYKCTAVIGGLAVFSNCGSYLATRDERMPATLWIWDIRNLRLTAILIHMHSVQSATWDPIGPRLAVTSGSSSVTLWTPKDVRSLRVPSTCLGEVSINNAKWHPAGPAMALLSKNKMTILKL